MDNTILIYRAIILTSAILFSLAALTQLIFCHAAVVRGGAAKFSFAQSLIPAILWGAFFFLTYMKV